MTELTAKYRMIHPDVLADILTMTHFGQALNADNPQQIGEYNIGIAILVKMGVFSKETKGDVIRALQSISPKEKT
jgi:hypothetical protein